MIFTDMIPIDNYAQTLPTIESAINTLLILNNPQYQQLLQRQTAEQLMELAKTTIAKRIEDNYPEFYGGQDTKNSLNDILEINKSTNHIILVGEGIGLYIKFSEVETNDFNTKEMFGEEDTNIREGEFVENLEYKKEQKTREIVETVVVPVINDQNRTIDSVRKTNSGMFN